MARIHNFMGSVEVQSGIKPKNGNDFPLIEAHSVLVDENDTRLDEYLENLEISGGGGANFETDHTLTLKDGVLKVNTANDAEADNTLPITAGAVYTQLGNIEILLETI